MTLASAVLDDLFERPFDRRTKRGLTSLQRRLGRIVAGLLVLLAVYVVAVLVASVS